MSFPYMLCFRRVALFLSVGRTTDTAGRPDSRIRSPFSGFPGTLSRMNGPDEETQISQVVERLEEKFPEVAHDDVERIVAEEREALDGNPVRDFVPRLVEHGAREKLRETLREEPATT